MAAARKVPRPFTMHWGGGVISEEASFTGEWSEPAIQLMDYTEGEAAGSWSIRFCSFNHRGQFQRSPLMLDADTVEGLREALRRTPRLRAILQQLVGEPTVDQRGCVHGHAATVGRGDDAVVELAVPRSVRERFDRVDGADRDAGRLLTRAAQMSAGRGRAIGVAPARRWRAATRVECTHERPPRGAAPGCALTANGQRPAAFTRDRVP